MRLPTISLYLQSIGNVVYIDILQISQYSIGNFKQRRYPITINNYLIMKREQLNRQIDMLEKKISALPEGDLLCVKNGKYFKYFKSNGKNPIYIPHKEHKLAEQLAAKKYYTLQLRELRLELETITLLLEGPLNPEMKAASLLEDSSGYKNLLKSYFLSFPNEVHQWQTENYEHNTSHPEHLIHNSFSGHKVRSKSEAIIANCLFINEIPYRYECALHFENMTFFPDFTILHPQTMELYYWEHFGMMDNQIYCNHAYNKLKNYSDHGLIPSINLITTYETTDHPIDSAKVQQIIEEYFL